MCINGSEKDKLLMEYALHGISNQLFVSRYQLYLQDREQLERELQNILLEEYKGVPEGPISRPSVDIRPHILTHDPEERRQK